MNTKAIDMLAMLKYIFIGCAGLIIICAILGLVVDNLRDHESSILAYHNSIIANHNYKRNELIYITSSELITNGYDKYLFCDTRPLSKYNRLHIAGAEHYTMLDINSARQSNRPVVYYGKGSVHKRVKRAAYRGLKVLHQPIYILSDGFKGWRNQHYPVQK